ncbi:L,D-transpeptidase family protein [Streptomyces sp. NPDC007084]|uniref:L,D-transpeptidase family protein n=1 Tax=Streptomyces sp. NPDC007084 TaxID=3154313 RepID=UPI003452D289
MMSRGMACRVVSVLLAVVAAVPVGSAVAVAAPAPPPPTGGRPLTGPASPALVGRVATGRPATPRTAPGRPAPGRASAGPASVGCLAGTGPYQRQVEGWLKLGVDGRQSRADCRAVRAFQVRQGIRPANGYAGPVTWARMRELSLRSSPATAANGAATGTSTAAVTGVEAATATAGCPVRSYRVACVDLKRQLTWVQKGGKTVFGPVPMRSGGVGHRTRTGWFRIYWKHKNHWSTLYNAPMPYAQFFSGGQAFHAVSGSINTTGGSMGCVNLRLADARRLWGVLKTRDHVYVWGRRPGS